ncbi:MAG TPA: AEC family transporter [Nitrospiraceae bacterium]|nr:AEC family transporter [Nitrospiraceae bacterium]
MLPVLEALFPIFSLIVIGFLFRRANFPGDSFWPFADRLTYFALFPALLLTTLATADIAGLPMMRMAGAIIAATLVIALILILLRRRLGANVPAFTSMFQGSIRPNTYVGLAAGGALFGEEGLALIAVAIAVLVPLVNLLSVGILTYYLSEKRQGAFRLLVKVLKNPLIIACGIGIGLNLTGIGLPYGTNNLLDIFSRAALPLGLLSVGAGLSLARDNAAWVRLGVPSALKLVLFPVLTAIACTLLGVTGLPLICAVLFTSLPSSVSSYILASQLGGDTRLMSGIITVETALSALTIPVFLAFLVS